MPGFFDFVNGISALHVSQGTGDVGVILTEEGAMKSWRIIGVLVAVFGMTLTAASNAAADESRSVSAAQWNVFAGFEAACCPPLVVDSNAAMDCDEWPVCVLEAESPSLEGQQTAYQQDAAYMNYWYSEFDVYVADVWYAPNPYARYDAVLALYYTAADYYCDMLACFFRAANGDYGRDTFSMLDDIINNCNTASGMLGELENAFDWSQTDLDNLEIDSSYFNSLAVLSAYLYLSILINN